MLPFDRALVPVNPNDPVRIVLKIRPKDDVRPAASELGSMLPLSRRRMSYRDYAARFGAAPCDIDAVVRYCVEKGLQPLCARPGARLVVVSGTAAGVEQAFGVNLHVMTDEGSEFRTYVGTPSLPACLTDVVTVIAGLEDSRLPVQWPPHGFLDQVGLRITTIARAYRLPPRLRGAGQRIGIIMPKVGNFDRSIVPDDVACTLFELGIDRSAVRLVDVADAPPFPGAHEDAEAMLDLQVAGAAAPGAELLLYMTPQTRAGWLEAVTVALHDPDHPLSVFSISFPASEYGMAGPQWTTAVAEEIDRTFAEAAVLGITVVVASGDNGFDATGLDQCARVMFPASSPYALAVGGTSATFDGDTEIVDEVVWDKGRGRQSGGGVSEIFARPPWQATANVPSSPSGFAGRGLPDVAALADLDPGYRIHFAGRPVARGGTSAGAPLWAALIARINERLGRIRRGCTVGYFTPLLYLGIGSSRVFRDVECGGNRLYQACNGWDPCTGWGSPNGDALLQALCERA